MNAARRRSLYFVSGKESRIVRTFSAWKPSGVRATVTKLFASRLAATTRTSESANSATISADRKLELVPAELRPPDFSASTGSRCAVASAGAVPNSRVVNSASPNAKANTRASSVAAAIPGTPGIQCGGRDPGNSRGCDGNQGLNPNGRQRDGQRCGTHGQHQRFRQKLPHDTGACGAQRYAHSNLRAPPQSAGDQQVRHVHAGNEKRHSHRSEEDENRRAALARDGIPQRADGQIRLSGAVARLGNDAFQNRQKFRARSRWRDAWAQACDHAEVEAAFAGAFPVDQGHGPPHLGWREWPDERWQLRAIRELKPWRHDPDDGLRDAVHNHLAAEHARVAAEAPLPEAVADDHHRVTALLVFLGRKCAPEARLGCQQVEKVGRDARRRDALRFATARQVKRNIHEQGGLLQRARVVPEAFIERRGDGPVERYGDQTARIAV